MSRFTIAIIMLLLAGAIFFIGLLPAWSKISEIRAEVKRLIAANDELQEIAAARDELTEQYNSIPQSDLNKLSAMLPTGLASSQFLKDIEVLGARHGMVVKNIDFSAKEQTQTIQIKISSGLIISPMDVSMNVRGSYDAMRSFLRDLEKMLRIYDISDLSFSAVVEGDKKGVLGLAPSDFAIKGTAYYAR